MTPPILVRLLGPVELHREGNQVQITGRNQRFLLALLAIHRDEVVSADLLLDAIYQGKWPKSGLNSLQVMVSGLRKQLEVNRGTATVLVNQPPGYRLLLDPDGVDSSRFERLWSIGREATANRDLATAAQHLQAALGLWRGDALADVRDELSLAAVAVRLEEMRLSCTEDLIDLDLARGGRPTMLADLERLVAANPLRERLHGQLMLALYRAGRQSEALLAYRRLRETLIDELGIEPSPAIARLEQQILRQDPGLETGEGSSGIPPVPSATMTRSAALGGVRLPEDASYFIGRREEVENLQNDVRRHRLVTLAGLGGAGKTRLAVEAARKLGEDFPNGVTFVDLSPVTDTGHAVAAVAAALRLDDDPGAVREQLRGRLAPRSLLLLDNAESLADARPLIDVLLTAGPGHLLVTSRVPTGYPGEVVRPVTALPVPPRGSSTAQLRGSDAVSLFVERAHEATREDEPDIDMVADIVRAVDGLPLAIELAAARLRVLSMDELNAEVARHLAVLADAADRRPARHRVLEALLVEGWSGVGEQGQRLLATLSMFRRDTTVAHIAKVAGMEQTHVLDLLSDALDRGLVRVQRHEGAGPRFAVLELIRRLAHDRAAARDLDELAAAHARHVADCVTARGGALPRDRDDLHAAIDTLCRLPAALAAVSREQRLALGRASVRLGIWSDAVTVLDPLARDPRAHNALGTALLRRGHPRDVDRGRHFLRAAAESGDQDAAAILGGSYKDTDPTSSYQWYLKALELDDTDPYALGNVIEHEMRTASPARVIDRRRDQLVVAMNRRRAEADRKEDLPWPWYDLARFELLLGNDEDGLRALLSAVTETTHPQQVQTSLRSFRALRDATRGATVAQACLLLELVLSTMDQKAAPPAGATGLMAPVLVLAGASSPHAHQAVMSWLEPLVGAVPPAGTIVAGGTQQGISALAAALAQRLPGWRSVGYLPRRLPPGAQASTAYDELRPTEAERFSILEPLTYWRDIRASGIPSSDIHVLGLGGGPLTDLELSLAVLLKANVAIANDPALPSSSGEDGSRRQVDRDMAAVKHWLAW